MLYTYVRLGENGSYYKGYTHDLEQRFRLHLSGSGAKHTARHKPIKIAYYETLQTEQAAIQKEKYFKSGSRREWLKTQLALKEGPI